MFTGDLFSLLLNQCKDQKEIRILDLCAAPGGKTTHLASILRSSGRPDTLLVANEAVSSRVTSLAENVARWGEPNVVVTNSDPSEFIKLKNFFDIILVDAPCSGEGMFRKDEDSVKE
ncbi:MAG: rRNA cytosine-C5-methyltransferase, partial [Bacteroidales bacterium]